MDFFAILLRGLTFLPNAVEAIEALSGGKTSEEKRQAAVEMAGDTINVADAVAARQIVDAAGFTEGLGKIVDGVVDCLNASVWFKG